MLEEQNASQEVSAFDRKVDSWLSIPRAAHVKPSELAAPVAGAPAKLAPASSMPPSVMAFEVRADKHLFLLPALLEAWRLTWLTCRGSVGVFD